MSALDKDVSQILNVISTMDDNDTLYVGRFTGGVWYDYNVTWSTLKTAIQNLVNTTPWSDVDSLAPNTSHYINMGDTDSYVGAIITFVFRRSNKYFFGKVVLISDGTDCYQNLEGAYEMPSASTGISLPYESNVNIDQMQLKITIDNSDSNTTFWQYQKILIPVVTEDSGA